MTSAELLTTLRNTWPGLDILEANGDAYIYYDPDRKLDHTRSFPFMTIVTSDAHDQASNLNRSPETFRLNIGITSATYQSLFGKQPPFPKDGDIIQTGHDFTQENTLLPHPVYAAMSFVSIINPTAETYKSQLVPLITESHTQAAEKY